MEVRGQPGRRDQLAVPQIRRRPGAARLEGVDAVGEGSTAHIGTWHLRSAHVAQERERAELVAQAVPAVPVVELGHQRRPARCREVKQPVIPPTRHARPLGNVLAELRPQPVLQVGGGGSGRVNRGATALAVVPGGRHQLRLERAIGDACRAFPRLGYVFPGEQALCLPRV